jgi:flagellar basal body-associated protein FliL
MAREKSQRGSAKTTILIIIVALIIIGGIWYWTKGSSSSTQPATNSAAAMNAQDTSSAENTLNSVDPSVQADVQGMTNAAKGH